MRRSSPKRRRCLVSYGCVLSPALSIMPYTKGGGTLTSTDFPWFSLFTRLLSLGNRTYEQMLFFQTTMKHSYTGY